MKYENNSKILDEIIITQRDPSNKDGIGYSPEENQGNSKHYAAALLSLVKKKDEEKAYNNQNSKKSSPIKKEYKTTSQIFYRNRYPHIFFGYCFACSNFGHKTINCRAYGKKNLSKNYNFKNNQTIDQVKNINYNPFTPSQEIDLE